MTTTLSVFPPGVPGGAGALPYLSGRWYTPYPFIPTTGTAVGTLDTVVYLTPIWATGYPLAAVSLNIRVVTGAVNSAVKLAVWENSPTTGRPTGIPILGSNTGQATTGTNSNATVAISKTFEPGRVYWFGAAFTTAAPTVIALNGTTQLGLNAIIGRSALNGTFGSGLTAPYAYATDILALDLTAATFTDAAGAVGNPVCYIGT